MVFLLVLGGERGEGCIRHGFAFWLVPRGRFGWLVVLRSFSLPPSPSPNDT